MRTRGIRQGVQWRIIHAGGRKIVVGIAIVSDGGVVRSDIDSVCGDGHWFCKIDLLPAGSRFSSEGCRGQMRTCVRPEITHVRSRVGRALVEANPGDGTARIRLKAHAQFHRGIRSRIRNWWYGRAWPDRILGLSKGIA